MSTLVATKNKYPVNFNEVKEKIPVIFFFENYLGFNPIKVGSGVRFCGCPSCGPSQNKSFKVSISNGRWKCFSCDHGGDVIDAAQYFYGVPHIEAAKRLLSEVKIPTNVKNWQAKQSVEPSKTKQRDPIAIKEVIQRLLEAQKDFKVLDSKVLDYLRSRGISDVTIKRAYDQKMLVVLPFNPRDANAYLLTHVGRELLEKAGMWSPNAKAPAIAYRPLGFVTSNQRAIEFRLVRAAMNDEDARFINYGSMSPFFIRGELDNEFVIVEGAIDLLSVLSFGSKRSVIGLVGSKRYKEHWFKNMGNKEVLLSLDPDRAGLEAIYGTSNTENKRGLIDILKDYEAIVNVFSFPPDFLEHTDPKDHDVNGFLLWKKSSIKTSKS